MCQVNPVGQFSMVSKPCNYYLEKEVAKYLINEKIQKPGIFRIKHHGAKPLNDNIQLYVIRFSCAVDNLFVKW